MADELTKVVEESARGGFFLISGTAVATVIMAIASIIIARFLGPELYGQYTLALVVPQLLFLFTDLGINQGIIKFTASFRVMKETHRIKRTIKYGLMLRAVIGIAIFTINYVFADFFASIFLQRPDLAFYIRIAAISVLFQVILTTVSSAFVGLDKTEYSALALNIQAIAKAIISITLVLLGFSIAGAIIGYVTSYFVAAIASMSILLIITRVKENNQNKGNISTDLKTIMHYGAPLYIATLLIGFIPLYQNVILAIFTTDADIGNYKAATNFISLMTIVAVPITTALLPAFSKLNSSTQQKVKAFYRHANKYTAMLIIPITVILIILSKEIVEVVYGHTYQSAPVFLTIYGMLYFLVGFGYLILPSLYNGLGETKTTLKMSVITFLTLAILSPIFTKTYNVQGLIVAFLIASTGGTIYGLHVARKNFQISVDTYTLLKIYLNSAVSSLPVLITLHLMHLPKFLTITIGGLSYLFLYVTLTPLTKAVTSFELETATHIIRKIRPLALLAKPILIYQQKLAHIRI
ncbi:MAG: oligosaccharide flippase family protein [Candidatus Bathycorpusculaceae bacterium]